MLLIIIIWVFVAWLTVVHDSMFPQPSDADRTGNAPAGTTIDNGLGHPIENDYYQLTHGGLLGTSRPAHYSVRRCFLILFLALLSFYLT